MNFPEHSCSNGMFEEQPPPQYTANYGGSPSNNAAVFVVKTVVPQIPVGSESMRTICPNCRAEINTEISRDPGLLAYLSGTLIFLLGGICCFCIPCCMKSCLDVKHTCPDCKANIGVYRAKAIF